MNLTVEWIQYVRGIKWMKRSNNLENDRCKLQKFQQWHLGRLILFLHQLWFGKVQCKELSSGIQARILRSNWITLFFFDYCHCSFITESHSLLQNGKYLPAEAGVPLGRIPTSFSLWRRRWHSSQTFVYFLHSGRWDAGSPPATAGTGVQCKTNPVSL